MLAKYNLVKQLSLGTIFNFLSILLSFVVTSLSVKYLGHNDYGLWMTIFSFVSWFSLFDFGIGNGLRNKLSQSLENNNINLSRVYISTSYFIFFVICITFVVVLLFLSKWIDWDTIFNVKKEYQALNEIILVTLTCFIFTLFLKLIESISFSKHLSYISSLVQFLNQLILLTVLVILIHNGFNKSILYYSLSVNLTQIFIYIFVSLFLFIYVFKDIRPSFKFIKFSISKDIFSIGGAFFIIQVCAISLYATDSFIINYFLSADYVTRYSILLKYYSIVTVLLAIILRPIWSIVSSSYNSRDFYTIDKIYKNLNKALLVIFVLILFLTLVYDYVFKLWIGIDFHVELSTVLLMAMYVLILSNLQIMSCIINGLGKLRLQLYLAIFASLINIPLSIYLLNVGLNVNGVLISSILVNLPGLIIYRIQIYKIINGKADKVWNM